MRKYLARTSPEFITKQARTEKVVRLKAEHSDILVSYIIGYAINILIFILETYLILLLLKHPSAQDQLYLTSFFFMCY